MIVFLKRTRRQLKRSFDNIRNERLKLNLLQALPFWAGSLITGLIAVLYTKIFSLAENSSSYLIHHHSWWMFILTPFCLLSAWWLVRKYATYARGSGIPQVMAAIELANPKHNKKVDRLLNARIIVIKIVSSIMMVLGGAVVGREGPTIQIAGSVFRKINLLLPDWWPKISKRNMIMTGAAAGLAAAFNTPLGGIVFAVEELTKTHISYFKTALFTAVIIAGLTAQAILGPYLYLGYPDVSNLSAYVFLAVLIVAILSGLMGSVLAKLLVLIMRWKSRFRFRYQSLLYIISCALILVMIGLFIDTRIFGSGKEIITHCLFTNDKYYDWYIPFLRMTGSVLSFTTGGSGGVFAPALAAGASTGSVIAGLFSLSDTNSNLLILAGMVGFLTGITRTPFTSAILVLEMTDRHNVIFHLMLAGMIASLAAMIIDKRSFYDHLKHSYLREILHEDTKNEEPTDEKQST